jgi:hypothetical protein
MLGAAIRRPRSLLASEATASVVAAQASTGCSSSCSAALRRTPVRLGMSQLTDDVPSGTNRPQMLHKYDWTQASETAGLSDLEKHEWHVMRRTQLEMADEWDDSEAFRSLPKPKKLMGNEACHAVWPYPWLVERAVQLHLYTKSVYVYYPHKALTSKGETFNEIAKQFTYEHLVPITFHNAHVYVEAELLVEHGDTPWVVVHCLDGRHKVVPVDLSTINADSGVDPEAPAAVQVQQGHRALLAKVIATAEELGSSVTDKGKVSHELAARPVQNGFVRVDYMWVPERFEDRNEHLVQWTSDDAAKRPLVRHRDGRLHQWVNLDDESKPLADSTSQLGLREKMRTMRPKAVGSVNAFHTSQRNSGTWGNLAGRGAN